jgi:hypothetical protein
MTDIVERLRQRYAPADIASVFVMREAAAEIERLQSCLYAQESVPALYAEIKRLRAALQRIADDGKNCADHCRRQARRALEPKLGE